MKRIHTLTTLFAIAISAMAQWSNSPSQALWINDNNEYFYSYDIAQTSNGNTWLYINGEFDTHYVQLYDSIGTALLGEDMLLVSDYPDRITGYIGQNLFVDREGNAIIVVSDLRYSPENDELGTYTAYKISQSGEMLWGEEGVSVDYGKGTSINAFMGITQLSDDSYIFTWTHSGYDQTIFSIDIQRVSNDGEVIWDPVETRLTDPEGKITYFWPYVVDAGYGQCILVYAKGANYDLYARKIDFDGTSVWSEDTRIYRSGFLSTPLWTVLDVQPSGDGGVIVTWYDDRYYTNTESIYMSYVKPNGELGFTSGEEGEKLGYSGYRALSTTCKYDPASDSFIALWREASQGQNSYRVVAQSVSKEGELLWGEEGLEIESLELEKEYGDLSLQYGEEGEMVAFYMKRNTLEYGNVDVRMQRINTLSGSLVWEESKILTDTISPTQKTDFRATTMAYNNAGVFAWDDRGVTSDINYKRLYIQRVNYDGTVGCKGNAAIPTVGTSEATLFATSTSTQGSTNLVVNMPETTQATINIYNINGTLISTPHNGILTAGQHIIECNSHINSGVYIATLTTPHERKTIKLTIKL